LIAEKLTGPTRSGILKETSSHSVKEQEETMKITVIGATGMIGSRIVAEALFRGHTVNAISRNPGKLVEGDRLHILNEDVKDVAAMLTLITGQDALVSATSPRAAGGNDQYLATIRAVLEIAERGKVPYTLIVGGASSLEIAPGRKLIEKLLESVPAERLSEPLVGNEARELIFASPANWTYFSPAGEIQPGARTGKFRLGGTQLLTDAAGKSRISAEDYAVAVLDELEQPTHARQQFTAAY
jgi:putative NADH-flavin reductase